MKIFGLGTLARHGKQTDICVYSHPTGGEMPLRRTRTFDSERPEVHAVVENDVGGDDVMRDRNVSNLPEKSESLCSSSSSLGTSLLLLL